MTTLRQQVEQELQRTKQNEFKTARMFRLEAVFKQDIVALITPQPGELGQERAALLGISEATLSEWRKLFNIINVRVYKPGPVPKCSRCGEPTRQTDSIETKAGRICSSCVGDLVGRVNA
jgi:hypothetical protein